MLWVKIVELERCQACGPLRTEGIDRLSALGEASDEAKPQSHWCNCSALRLQATQVSLATSQVPGIPAIALTADAS